MGLLAKAILSQKAPNTLYHYTTQAGLIAILKSKALWASKMQYLNDASEFHHSLTIGKEVLAKRPRETTDNLLLNGIERALNLLAWTHIFVGSLSNAGDLLSQWRGYCPDGNGFCIGFNVEQLRNALTTQAFQLAPCVYDEGHKKELVSELIDDAFSFSKDSSEELFSPRLNPGLAKLSKSLGPQVSLFVREFLAFGALLKHDSFSEEKEWRILCGVIPHTHSDFRIRPGKSMLIPYREISLVGSDDLLHIDEIIVGPTPHADLAKQSAQNLVDSLKGLKKTKVRSSRIPYRAW
jgi:Protein of unknown function (DUF2971)